MTMSLPFQVNGITFGVCVGVMCFAIIAVMSAYILTIVLLIRSKNALLKRFNVLESTINDQPVVYEEIVSDTPTTFDTEENTAYLSATNQQENN